MTRKDKWYELNPELGFLSTKFCPYPDGIRSNKDCVKNPEITCEECWEKEYDDTETFLNIKEEKIILL